MAPAGVVKEKAANFVVQTRKRKGKRPHAALGEKER